MSEVIKKGWKCDICGREYYERDFNNSKRNSVLAVENNSKNLFNYDDVCDSCIEEIQDCIDKLKN
jgi:hypothetical protein